MSIIAAIACIVFGYTVGSCPTGYMVVRWMTGDDIRKLGSGNTGATNVGRVLGKRWAIFTAVFDMLKGGLAILIVSMLGADGPVYASLTGAAAVIGHDFPVWLSFKGGKGVATSFGVFAFFDFFDPIPAMLGGIVWFIVCEKTRYVSAASLAGLSASSIMMLMLTDSSWYFYAAAALTALSAVRHTANIKRMLAGTEYKTAAMLPRIFDLFDRLRRIRL